MRNSSSVVWTIFGALMLGVGWFGHQVFGPKPHPREMRTGAAPSVAVAEVRTVAFNPPSEYVGHVEPVQEVDILPHIEGYLKKVCFEEGAKVREGDVLFEIDDEQYVAALNLQKSNVRSAEAKVAVAKAEVDRAERYYRRLKDADDRGVMATERDTAETTLASARAALKSAEADVAEAKASMAIAEFNMKHTLVHSPISGRIGKALHHVGDFVSPSKSALAHVVQLDPIRVTFPITDRDCDSWRRAAERENKDIRDTQRLRLVLPDGSVYGKTGTLDFGDNQMDRTTATVVMHVRFDNPTERLMPNQYVKVVSDERSPETVIAVPTLAMVKGTDDWCVWVVGEDSTVRRRAVVPGVAWEGRTAVKSGLRPGERVVFQGTHKLQDGCAVLVVSPTEVK